jgi:hypothetical protein
LDDLPTGASDMSQAGILFPKKYPFIWDANYLY